MLIKLDNVSKIYQTEGIATVALDCIGLEIMEGEFVAIMGASGCGKSTLLNIIGMIDDYNSGSYLWLDQPINDLDTKQRGDIRKSKIGFIFQNFNLIDELTVEENIELPLTYNNIAKPDRIKMVNKLLDSLNLRHRSHYFPQQLSGGQQQRTAVARALAVEPLLILADEPTGNLDSQNGNEVMEILADLHLNGSTIIMVTHSLADANFANRIIQLKDGRILSEKRNKRQIDIIKG